MLFGRVILDDDTFLVQSGLLGGIHVSAKAQGIRRSASLSERMFLTRIIDLMKQRGVPIQPGSKPLEKLLHEFAEAVCLRGGLGWQVFFQGMTPEDHVKYMPSPSESHP